MNNKDKILSISKELGLTHIGSNLSVLPILEEIYAKKKPEDKVILDNAHAGLSHAVVMEEYQIRNAPKDSLGVIAAVSKIINYGIHCDRKAGCDASGGSLGHGLGISIGYALANPDITIFCIVSDGSMHEGSNWEALRIVTALDIKNLKIYTNFNGYTAVANISVSLLEQRMQEFSRNINYRRTDNTEGFEGVQGHYKKI